MSGEASVPVTGIVAITHSRLPLADRIVVWLHFSEKSREKIQASSLTWVRCSPAGQRAPVICLQLQCVHPDPRKLAAQDGHEISFAPGTTHLLKWARPSHNQSGSAAVKKIENRPHDPGRDSERGSPKTGRHARNRFVVHRAHSAKTHTNTATHTQNTETGKETHRD